MQYSNMYFGDSEMIGLVHEPNKQVFTTILCRKCHASLGLLIIVYRRTDQSRIFSGGNATHMNTPFALTVLH